MKSGEFCFRGRVDACNREKDMTMRPDATPGPSNLGDYASTNSAIRPSTSFSSGKRSRASFEKTFLRFRKTSNDPEAPGAIVTARSRS